MCELPIPISIKEEPPHKTSDKCQSYYLDILKCMRNVDPQKCIGILESDDFQKCDAFKKSKTKQFIKHQVNWGYVDYTSVFSTNHKRYSDYASGNPSDDADILVHHALKYYNCDSYYKSKLTWDKYLRETFCKN